MQAAARKRKDPLVFFLVFGMMAVIAGMILLRSPRHREGAPLFAAIANNDLQGVERLLDRGEDVNARRKSDGATPLLEAADRDIALVRRLLAKGAEVNVTDVVGETPLLRAMRGLRADIAGTYDYVRNRPRPQDKRACRANVELLLERGAFVNAQDNQGSTPLITAVTMRQPELVDYLLKHGADPAMISKAGLYSSSVEGGTPISYAAEQGSLDILKRLLDAGVEVNARNLHGATPLILAARWGRGACVRHLLQHGADPNLHTRSGGDTALTFAVRASSSEQTDCVRALLEKGADVNVRNGEGDTPLLIAAQYGTMETLQRLLQHKPDVNAQRLGRPRPLVFSNQLEAQRKTPPASTRMSVDAVPAALVGGRSAVQKPPPNHPPNAIRGMLFFSIEGDTPLSYAAMFNRVEVIRLLLAHGADIHRRNTRGDTPLHIAAAHGQPDAIQCLLQMGANASAQNDDGKTPLQLAQKMGQVDVQPLLQPTR